jgi:hypothetical protein
MATRGEEVRQGASHHLPTWSHLRRAEEAADMVLGRRGKPALQPREAEAQRRDLRPG